MRAAALVGAGVLIVAVVIAAIALAPRAPASGSPSPSAALSAASESPSAPAAASPVAPAGSTLPDLASLLRPLVASWRPSEPFLLVQRSDELQTTLLAVPLTGAAATPLVTFKTNGIAWGFQLRDDASTLAVSLPIDAHTARIAIWDLASGTTRWLTGDEPGMQYTTPVWSEDGSLLYYAAHSASAQSLTDLGIFRVRSDGTGRTRVRAPEENGAELGGLTPDGRGLFWARIRAGGAVEVLDLASGVNRSFDETTTAFVLSWRRARPRALVEVGGCCAGRPGGALALWDDTAGSSRTLLGPRSTPPLAVTSASWEPSGARFAAVVIERSGPSDVRSVRIYDAEGRQLAVVAGTEGAQQVLWLPMGIVVRRGEPATEILLVPPEGGTVATLFRDPGNAVIRSIVGP